MTDFIQVMTTVAKRDDAEDIARKLVGERLAACVQVIGPVQSTYWWEGRLETGEEWLCLAKSRLDLYPSVEQAIRAIHPYQVPEILAVPVVAGFEGYLAWMQAELRGRDAEGPSAVAPS
jgi:periplasmic divalent cation tolerance protein